MLGPLPLPLPLPLTWLVLGGGPLGWLALGAAFLAASWAMGPAVRLAAASRPATGAAVGP
ncbi:hypothetical protein [Streptomyces sp. SS8]